MDEKLDNIIKTSVSLFKQYGIRSISMDDVAREMGISKKTLYLYIENKADLVKKVLDNHLCEIHSREAILENKKLNAIDVMLEVSKDVCNNLKEFNPAITFDLQKYYPEIFKDFLKRNHQQILSDVTNNIHQGIKEGIYRNDIKVELVALLYMKKLQDIHNPDFITSAQFTFKNVFEVMFESHIRGIANMKGVKYLEKQMKSYNFNL